MQNAMMTKRCSWIQAQVLLICVASLTSCPDSCECIWRHGKITAECASKNLRSIPENIDPQVQVLDVSGNTFPVLLKGAFSSKGLLNLQRLYLNKCRISEIDADAFAGLSNLVELDLSSNALVRVPSECLKHVPSLRIFQLNNNPIETVENFAFGDVGGLVKIEMSSCSLSFIAPRAFERLEYVETLKINGNQLTRLSENIIVSLHKLHNIFVHDNPWHCDCTLRPLRNLLLQYNVPYPISPVCSSPQRAQGKLLDQIDDYEFACPPEILDSERRAVVRSGQNATVVCKVNSVPSANITWVHRDGVVNVERRNRHGHRKYVIIENGNEQKSSFLTVVNAEDSSTGELRCIARNPAGTAEANFSLTVVGRLTGPMNLSDNQVVGLTLSLILVIVSVIAVILFLLIRIHVPKQKKGHSAFKATDADGYISPRNLGPAPPVTRLADNANRPETERNDVLSRPDLINGTKNSWNVSAQRDMINSLDRRSYLTDANHLKMKAALAAGRNIYNHANGTATLNFPFPKPFVCGVQEDHLRPRSPLSSLRSSDGPARGYSVTFATDKRMKHVMSPEWKLERQLPYPSDYGLPVLLSMEQIENEDFMVRKISRKAFGEKSAKCANSRKLSQQEDELYFRTDRSYESPHEEDGTEI